MISAVILTKNEEENIVDCLKSLSWVDEIVVIDDYSSDKTVQKILEKFPPDLSGKYKKIKILRHSLGDDFSQQRSLGLKEASGEWVFFLDADERVTPELACEIQNLFKKNHPFLHDAYLIKRRDYLFGRWLKHGETGNTTILRLAKKKAGFWRRPVHEFWNINGAIGSLHQPLLHYPHQTVEQFLKEINFYTDLNAKYLFQKSSFARGPLAKLDIIFYPLAKFIKNYVFLLGFLDGTPGFLHAIFMSFHSFLTRAKLWQFHENN